MLDVYWTVATVTDDSCTATEESISTSIQSSSTGRTMQPEIEIVLWKKFDQRMVDSVQARTNAVGVYVESSNIYSMLILIVMRIHLLGGNTMHFIYHYYRNLLKSTFAFLVHLYQQKGYFQRLASWFQLEGAI